MENIKVCVRVPKNKKEELMTFAKNLREAEISGKTPGWDSKAIHSIARSNYNSLREFFEFQQWPERGKHMMPKVQSRVKDAYGSIENFVSIHNGGEDCKAYQVTDSENNKTYIVKISGTVFAVKGEEACKEMASIKYKRNLFEEDGTIFVSTLDFQ